MDNRLTFWRLIGPLALVTFWSAAHAQSGLGVVRGTVQDASQAVVPNAKVQLTNTQTNIVRDTKVGAEGIYYFGSIPPGPYTLSVESEGFKRWSGTFTVEVGRTVVIDPQLEVGAVTATVEVTGAVPTITTEGMQISNVKDSLRIRQLPLNQRDVTSLFNLTPGVEGGAAPRVNGAKVGATEVLQDGVTLVDRFGGGVQRIRPGLDTVQEFRIETAGSNARYSRPATVQLVTKSGTNELHGSAFETFRNNGGGLRARQRQDGSTPAFYNRNEFGASAGGPVMLPKLYDGRNRSFWFFAYEGLRERTKVFDQDYVPTADMWNGDFSKVIDNSGVQTHIYDPLSTNDQGVRQPFPGDIVPVNRQSAIFKTFKSITHAPTNNTNPFQDYNLFTFYPRAVNNDTYTLKGDQRFSEKDSLSGRFTRSRNHLTQTGGRFGSPLETLTNGYGTSRGDNRVYSFALTETHTFHPNLLNEFLALVNRNPNSQGTLADDTPWANQLGLPNPFGTTGWPSVYTGNDPWGWDADNRKDQNLTAYQIEDNVTWIKGKHTFQFGGMLRRENNNVRELQQAQGSHDFGGDWTALYDPASNDAKSNTGVGLASLALGLPTYLSNQYNRGFFYFQQWNAALYFQDTYKLSRRLTLDLGLRWEKWTPYHELQNRLVNVDLNTYANTFQVITPGNHTMESLPGIPPAVLTSWARRGLTWKTANEAGFPSALTPSVNTDFGPRIGVAYRLNDKTVIRGGYGRYFWTMPLSQILQTSRTNPPLNLRFENNVNQSADGDSTFGFRTAPGPGLFVGQVGVNTQGIVTLPSSARSMMPWDVRDWKDDMIQSWQFVIEREIMKDTALKLYYIGNRGSNLEQRFSVNAQEAQYNYVARTGQQVPGVADLRRVNRNWAFDAENHTGYSNTHSAQAEIERRFSSGIAFQWFYTFTRSLTTTDAGASTAGTGDINNTSGTAVVPDNIQIFGEPNLSYDQRLRLIYYNSTAIPAHRMRWNGLFDLPFGRGKKFGQNAPALLEQLIGGWQIATIGDWRSGNWLSVPGTEYLFGNPSLSSDQRLEFYYNGKPQRLFFAGDFDPTKAKGVDLQKLYALVPVNRAQRVMHPVGAAFDNRLPQTLADGTVRQTSITDMVSWNSRAFIMGPRAWNSDISVFKNFSFKERYVVRFTADFFNAFNHPVDPNPNSTTGLQDLSVQTNDPRIIQLSLRFSW
jgi:hypothetical protein